MGTRGDRHSQYGNTLLSFFITVLFGASPLPKKNDVISVAFRHGRSSISSPSPKESCQKHQFGAPVSVSRTNNRFDFSALAKRGVHNCTVLFRVTSLCILVKTGFGSVKGGRPQLTVDRMGKICHEHSQCMLQYLLSLALLTTFRKWGIPSFLNPKGRPVPARL